MIDKLKIPSDKAWWLVLSVLVLAYLLRFWLAYDLSLTDTTEARYAEIARKMVELSQFVLQHDYGIDFWGKPPLSFWLSALGIKFFGATEIAARIFLLLTSFLFLLGFYFWVRRLFNARTAILACLVLTTSLFYFASTAIVSTDLLLTVSVATSLMAFWLRLQGGKRVELFLYLGLALGLLAKGPIAVVFILVPIGIWVLLHKKTKQVLREFAWLRGLLLCLLIVLPWYVLMEIKSPGFLRYFIIEEHFSRFFAGKELDQSYLFGRIHEKPLGYIWVSLLVGGLPWSLVIAGLALKDTRKNARAFYQQYRDLINFLLIWMLVPLFLFSFTKSILEIYALPALLPFLLLVVMLIMNVSEKRQTTRIYWSSCLATITLLLLFLLSFKVDAEAGFTIKNSQKRVINYASSKEFSGCQILVFQERFDSADYYSKGRVRTVSDFKHFKAMAENNKCSLLLVGKRIEDRLTPADLSQLVLLKTSQKTKLFLMTPPNSPASPELAQ